MRLYALALVAVSLAGCHLIFPFDTSSSAGAPDGAADVLPAVEVALPADGAPPDAAPPDAPTPDAPPPDQGPADSEPHDQAPPDQPSSGCINSTLYKALAADVVICKSTAVRNQCSAHALCDAAAGWSICTASEYLARVGTKVDPKAVAWLAGCVREGGAVTPPVDKVCSACVIQGAPTSQISSWTCSTGYNSMGYSTYWVGVATYTDCRRVGKNDGNFEAYWYPLPSVSAKAYTVCCK